MVAFITTFFIATQENVHRAVANSAQMQILYKAFSTVWETVGDRLSESAKDMNIDELIKVDTHLANVAKEIAGIMQQSGGEKKKPEENKPSQ